eukprot:CAMPEP_0176093774 /NCGR_PEP_ID=MMETSP0120_2-20121206/46988_1 /TAXON_ID=160619 /ORGANISM="Kryptoperidinium foliaceum, Strain CCMP 1326" /LENGTH=945 /DNA_ID=CAMNT_0017427709 /DNA_START=53 /DNA_END=2887 /DNA_ORIENTATION=-
MSVNFEVEVLSQLRTLGDASARIEQHLRELSLSRRDDRAPAERSRSKWFASLPDVMSQIQEGDELDLHSLHRDATGITTGCDACSNNLKGRDLLLDSRASASTPSARYRTSAVAKSVTAPKHKFVAPSLPLDWPAVLKLRTEMSHSSAAPPPETGVLQRFAARFSPSGSDSDLEPSMVKKSRFVLDPSSQLYTVYSILMLIILVYDLTLLPYTLAFEMDIEGFLLASAWLIPSFWTFDFGINFCTGFYRGGEIVYDFREIRRMYCKCWLLPDMTVLLCDWASLLITMSLGRSGDGNTFAMMRFVKAGRLLRSMGMMRMVRATRILDELLAKHSKDAFRLLFKMLSLFGFTLWIAHVLACLWYVVGISGPNDTGHRWTDFLAPDDTSANFLEQPRIYQYLVAFHWAAASISLGGVDVGPATSLERIVYVAAMLFGFIFGSVLVSLMSAAMMDYQMMRKGRTMKLRTLRQYLQENNVPAFVAIPVQKQVEQRLSRREAIAEGDVAALGLLSAALRAQLRFEIQRPHLSRHPLFRLWTDIDAKLMHRTCMQAVSFTSLRPRDELFYPGGLASAAMVVERGRVIYTQHPDSAPVDVVTTEEVGSGLWICEAALWVHWTHVGKADAEEACGLLSVNANALCESLQKDFIVSSIATQYGRQFHRRVTFARPPHADYPTDLRVPFTDYCDLVVSMTQPIQRTIGMTALSRYGAGFRGAKALDKLREEVDSCKSIVVVTGDGALVRVVSLVVLRATMPDHRVFMQIGKYGDTGVIAALQLPGVKQGADELVCDTLDRMFATRLSCLSGRVELLSTVRENFENESKEYGVQTKYMRSICSARLLQGEKVNAPSCHSWPSEGGWAEECIPAGSVSNSRTKLLNIGQQRLLKLLFSTEVYAVPSSKDDDRTGNFYAWLPSETVNLLGTPSGEKVLRTWISGIRIPQATISETGPDY